MNERAGKGKEGSKALWKWVADTVNTAAGRPDHLQRDDQACQSKYKWLLRLAGDRRVGKQYQSGQKWPTPVMEEAELLLRDVEACEYLLFVPP
jgi:hypothetical protein